MDIIAHSCIKKCNRSRCLLTRSVSPVYNLNSLPNIVVATKLRSVRGVKWESACFFKDMNENVGSPLYGNNIFCTGLDGLGI
jgi:hypothetical protein